MGSKSKIEWTDMTWSPVTGCKKVSPGCKHCLAPETLILYRDWTWRPLEDAKVGDEILGFPEGEGVLNRRLEVSVIEKKWEVQARALEIEAGDKTIIASYEHPFVARSGSSGFRWKLPRNFRLMRTQLRTIPCYPFHSETNDYRRGYIAGATDGDGTFRIVSGKQSYWRVAVAEKQIAFLQRLAKYLKALAIAQLDIKTFNPGPTQSGLPTKMLKVETRKFSHLKEIESFLVHPQSFVTSEFKRGWLAGMFDAEGSAGSLSRRVDSLRISNTNIKLLEKIVEYGSCFGFNFQVEKFPKKTITVRLYGSRSERGRFFGITQPALQYKTDVCLGRTLDFKDKKITALRDLGTCDLIDIQTSTRTFFANGFATHNCYAETMHSRLQAMGSRKYTEPFSTVRIHPEELNKTFGSKPKRIFVCSMSDLFGEEVPEDFIIDVLAHIADVKKNHHIFQVLTKRAERMNQFLTSPKFRKKMAERRVVWPVPHVWLGVSAENQQYADERIPLLLHTPAYVRFVSAEPLLGPINLRLQRDHCDLCGGTGILARWPKGKCHVCKGKGEIWVRERRRDEYVRLDWVIVGGESGKGARPMDSGWVRSLRAQCHQANVAFFFKQMAKKAEIPKEFMVRQYPDDRGFSRHF